MSETVGWTTSYRWSGSARSEVRRLFKHSMRDLDLRNGVAITHSNQMIIEARTLDNETFISDSNGGFERAENIDQFVELLDNKLATAPKNVRRYKDGREVTVALRKDAAVMLEYILQLDPEWTGTWADATAEKQAETKQLLRVMIDEVIERDGYANVLGWSLNIDETNAHIHMYTVPVDEYGRVNMKAKFNGKTKDAAQRAYSERHDQMRSRLQDAGYEATFARIEGSPKHSALAKYKEQEDSKKELTAAWHDIRTRGEAFHDRNLEYRDAVVEREAALEAEKAAWELEEPKLRAKAKSEAFADGYADGVSAGEATVAQEIAIAEQRAAQIVHEAQSAAQRLREKANEDRRHAKQTLRDTNKMYDEINAELARLVKLPPVFEEYLDSPTKSGKTLRASFERFASTIPKIKSHADGLRTGLDEIGAEIEPQNSFPEP